MLNIHNLHVRVQDQSVLNGIDLSVAKGKIHALMGPNGSGKSTLTHTLIGHPDYRVTQGTITYRRHNLLDLSTPTRARQGIFLAYQRPVALPGITVFNLLQTASEAVTGHPIKSVLAFRQQLITIAQNLNIKPEFLSRYVNDGFSGGEQKRLEMLQLLTLKPRLAILDEIDSGLDIDSLKLVAQGIRTAVTSYHTAVIIITHYRRILDHIKPDHVHVLLKGRLIASDGPRLINRIERYGYRNFSGHG